MGGHIVNKIEAKLLEGDDKDLILTAALNGCIKQEASFELTDKFRDDADKEKTSKRISGALNHSLGMGHNAALDLVGELVSVKNMTFVDVLAMNGITFGTPHLERSTRRSVMESVFIPDCILENEELRRKVEEHIEEMFTLYNKFLELGATMEDAMMILPIYYNTNCTYYINGRAAYYIYQMFTGNHSRFDGKHVAPFKRSQTMIDFGNMMFDLFAKKNPNLFKKGVEWGLLFDSLDFYPGSMEMFCEQNVMLENTIAKHAGDMNDKTALLISDNEEAIGMSREQIKDAIERRDEAGLANLRNLHYTFLAYVDLAVYKDYLRNRTIDFTIEPLYSAAERGEFYIPRTIKSKNLVNDYIDSCKKSLELYKYLVANGVEKEEAVGFIPSAVRVFSLASMNAFSLIHAACNRICLRGRPNYIEFTQHMKGEMNKINSVILDYLVPRGLLYNLCPDKNIAEGGGKCMFCYPFANAKV
ncbi:MAG: FAD-dependent thymidylate synthase [Candidatus Aenigmatarchaeota archaeon]